MDEQIVYMHMGVYTLYINDGKIPSLWSGGWLTINL